MRRLSFGLIALLAALGHATRASAQCASPELLDAIPPDGATDVPVAWSTAGMPGYAPLRARYDIGAVHNGEPVILQPANDPPRDCGDDSGPWCLAATWDPQLLTLSVIPPEGFQAGIEYEVVWPGLASLTNSEVRGDDTTVRFSVGFATDTERPRFEGLSSVAWDFERKYDSCSDTDAERYVFDVGVPPPSDDGGSDLLTLRIFQTRGPTLGGIPTEVYVERYTGRGSARVTRPISAGIGDICFSALVSDPGGNFSTSANREVCTKTVRPPFFDGCALSHEKRPSALSGLALAFLLVVGAWRRGKHEPVRNG